MQRAPIIDADQHKLCFESLANRLRLDILKLLQKGAKNVTELSESTGAERSRVSHALKVLRECHLVETEKRGREVTYCINPKTPLFKKGSGNIFDLITEHARHCQGCPRRAR